MTKTFKVAGHCFSLHLPDGIKVWDSFSQYDPFIVGEGESEVFSLTLTKDQPLEKGKVLFDAPTEDGQTVIKLYDSGSGYVIEMSPDKKIPPFAWISCSKDWRSARLYVGSRKLSDFIFAVNNSLMLLYAFTTSGYGTLEMHASVIMNGGRSYLFLGKSGTGKSTHSSLWLKHIEGSVLMNDDNPVVRVWPDGKIIAYGSPWSGKTPCYKNVEAPVGAFVALSQYPENRINEMGLLESYAAIYSSSSGFKFDEKMADDLHRTIESVITGVPCFHLDCLPDEAAARLCANTVRR